MGRDSLGDRTGDGLRGVDESFLTRHALLDVSAEKSLDDSVDGTKKDATLTIDIRLKVISINYFQIGIGCGASMMSEDITFIIRRSIKSLNIIMLDKSGLCYLVLLSHGCLEHEWRS